MHYLKRVASGFLFGLGFTVAMVLLSFAAFQLQLRFFSEEEGGRPIKVIQIAKAWIISSKFCGSSESRGSVA